MKDTKEEDHIKVGKDAEEEEEVGHDTTVQGWYWLKHVTVFAEVGIGDETTEHFPDLSSWQRFLLLCRADTIDSLSVTLKWTR